jgi:hypothetical protein
MCSCGKKVSRFKVTSSEGKTQEVKTEQEARALARINGGSYAPVKA